MTLIEELLDLQIPQDIRLSPNIEQVVYSTSLLVGHKPFESAHTVGTIWLADTDKEKSARQLTSGLFNDRKPEWHPDGKGVTFLSDRAKAGESCAIYLLPTTAGGEAYPLTPSNNEKEITFYKFSHDGKFIAFISADEKTAEQKAKEEGKNDPMVWGEDWPYGRVRLLHIATKQVVTLAARDAHVFDQLDWNKDSTKVVFAETKSPDVESSCWHGSKISIVDIGTKQIKQVCHFPRTASFLTWAENSLYFTSGVDLDNSLTAEMVYKIDLESTSPKYEKFAQGKTSCAMGLQRSKNSVAVLIGKGFEDQIGLLDGPLLFSESKEIGAWNIGHTPKGDETALALTQEDTASPREVFFVTKSKDPVQLSSHGGAIADKHLGYAKFLKCRSADGKLDIDAVYFRPGRSDQDKGNPLPTVVHMHGGPYGCVTDSFNPSYYHWSGPLLAAGYGVLMPNYRGGSGHGNDFTTALRAAAGIGDYDDVITLTQHAISEGLADPTRLVASGWSQGGFLTYLCTVRNGLHGHGWKYRATIPGAGISDPDTCAFTSDFGAFQEDFAPAPPWRSDKSDVRGRAGSSIWEFNAAVQKGGVIPPVLILHGEKDERVAPEQARVFRRAMESAHLPFEMVMYPREGHFFMERRHMVDMGSRVLRFVDTHIGGSKED